MKREIRSGKGLPAESKGARSATGDSAGGGAAPVGPLGPGQRWSAGRKRDVVLRLLRGESIEALSRELGVERYLLEKWKSRGLDAIEASVKERGADPLQSELNDALKRIGELSMENELLRVRCKTASPLAWRGSRR